MCMLTDFKTVPLRYLCGTLYINFRLIWEPVTKIIASYGNTMDMQLFWSIFGELLRISNVNVRNLVEVNIAHDFKSSYTFLENLYVFKCTSKPDFANYRILLWQSLTLFAKVAESKTRDVSDIFLDFIE